MENEEIKTLLDKNLIIVQQLEKKALMFGKGMFVLSLFDVIFGVLAIFCTSLSLTALFASATSLTAITICGRIIQVSKIKQLNKSLKVLNIVSITWFVNRYKNYLKKEKKVKMTKSTILQKILTTIIALFGIGGVVVFFIPQFTPVAKQVTDICAMVSEGLAVVSGIWLSATSDKVLSDEEIAEKEKAEKAKQLEKAKALIAKSQENAKALEEAKALVAEADKKVEVVDIAERQ